MIIGDIVRIMIFAAGSVMLTRFYRQQHRSGEADQFRFPVRKADIAAPAAAALITAAYDVLVLNNPAASGETAAVLGTLKLYIVDIALLVFTLSRIILQFKQKRKQRSGR